MTNDKPKERADVCLGWFCNYRDNCDRHIEKKDVVITRYFQPLRTGEHCEFFTDKKHGTT